jgi:xanthine dehydrogenase accessory factor
MTCGGRVEILLDRVLPTEENQSVFSHWLDTLQKRKTAVFLTTLCKKEDSRKNIHRSILFPNETLDASFPLPEKDIRRIRQAAEKRNTQRVLSLENALVLMEPAIFTKSLHIFGAGHVAAPTAELAVKVGFEVIVMDDREEFASPARFPDAVQTRVVAGFDDALPHTSFDGNDFIVIVTRGHLHDKVVLGQALKTPAAYIGMIGSRKKRDAIYAALLEEGFNQQDIDRVHCPIGIPIGAETPEEIAVSIVAELIQKRAERAS